MKVPEAAPLLMTEEFNASIKRILSRKKAPGPDGINTALLSAVHHLHPQWLLALYNKCIPSGTFPNKWKVGRLILIRKGSKPVGEPSSYRPLCLLDDVGKLFEFLLVQRVDIHLKRKGDLSAGQFGFRRVSQR